ncbi:hypothetical protein SOVF_210550, partial [Spinacia oleracea]
MAFIKPRELGGKILRKKECVPSPPSYVKLSSNNGNDDDDEEGTPKGHVPVMVGNIDEGELKRFVVPTGFMKDPSIVTLLKLSAAEFGYNQEGVLQIPCHPECFQKII